MALLSPRYPHTQILVGPTLWLCLMCEVIFQRHLTIIKFSLSVEHQAFMARIKMFALLVLFR